MFQPINGNNSSDTDDHRTCICCLKVKCLHNIFREMWWITVHLFLLTFICMGSLLMDNLFLMSTCTFDGGQNNVYYVLFTFNESLLQQSQSYSFLVGRLLQQLDR